MNRKLGLPALALVCAMVCAGVAIAAASPSVTTGGVSSVGGTSAQLNGTVNPNGAATVYHFDYGLTATYGLTTTPANAGAGTSKVSVKATVKGLLPGTTYHYRLDAANSAGGALGKDRTFKTSGNPPPQVATGPATGIGASSVTVTGVVNPRGQSTTWVFQYGLTSGYTVQTVGGVVPAGGSSVTVSQQLTGLEPGTTFHYRLVALHNGSATQLGADATFMTLPRPRPVPKLHATTTPHRDGKSPFVFQTIGRLIASSSTPASLRCVGSVRISFYLGRNRVARNNAPIEPDCTFANQKSFRKLPGRGPKGRTVKLRVVIFFRGNSYLAPTNARTQTVILG